MLFLRRHPALADTDIDPAGGIDRPEAVALDTLLAQVLDKDREIMGMDAAVIVGRVARELDTTYAEAWQVLERVRSDIQKALDA